MHIMHIEKRISNFWIVAVRICLFNQVHQEDQVLMLVKEVFGTANFPGHSESVTEVRALGKLFYTFLNPHSYSGGKLCIMLQYKKVFNICV